MCGIVGFISPGGFREHEGRIQILSMAQALHHRGPDNGGIWLDPSLGVSLGHRRLSIIDLSPCGNQPMLSRSGRYVIVFNGEIYNYLDIRRSVENALSCSSSDSQCSWIDCGRGNGLWKGHSDTEVILEAFELWGVEKTLQTLVGMFALALWDREDRVLHLARDRMGEKPLYYGWLGKSFVFASELRALRRHPEWHGDIDRNSLESFMRYGYVPAPYSIFRNIYKLPPATRFTFCLGITDRGCDFSPFPSTNKRLYSPKHYWSLEKIVRTSDKNHSSRDPEEAVNHLDKILRSAVRGQMISDVPYGAFLSGGVDSSTIVALMQEESGHPIKTFSIGFEEKGYDEAVHAREVAGYLGTDHTEMYVTAKDAMSVIPELPNIYDEPFADPSQIPTYLLSRMARQHVTVVLSGDGGDELFCGYNRYFWSRKIWRKFGRMPIELRRLIASIMTTLSPSLWDRMAIVLEPMLPRKLRFSQLGAKLHKVAELLQARNSDEIHERLISHWDEPAAVVKNVGRGSCAGNGHTGGACVNDFVEQMMYLDTITYLPDDILVKVDRAAMAVSLETRIPLLDHRVVEFAWQLPLEMKLRDRNGKWLLREVLYRYVPRRLIERPKMGFSIPIDMWLRGPLREWSESQISESRLKSEGFFRADPVLRLWREHLSGRRNWQFRLWNILMFQAWIERESAAD